MPPRDFSTAVECAREHLHRAERDNLIGVSGAGTIDDLREALEALVDAVEIQQVQLDAVDAKDLPIGGQ